MRSVTIGKIKVEPGVKRHGFIKVADSAEGMAPLAFPFILANGLETGPCFCVTAGVHADEYEAQEIVVKSAQALDPKKLKGVFIGVPIINVPGYEVTQYAGLPFDKRYGNISRRFPGRADGEISERYTNAIVREIFSKADYYLDIHGGSKGAECGGVSLVTLPPPDYPAELRKKCEEMAVSFGAPILYREKRGGEWPRTSNLAAAKMGIPSIRATLGVATDRYERRGYYVNLGVKGVFNIMKHLGMLAGKPELPKTQTVVASTYVYCNTGGFWTPKVKDGAEVREGDTLGIVTNLFGEEIDRYKAPRDGLICGVKTFPMVHPGDLLYWFGDVLETIRH